MLPEYDFSGQTGIRGNYLQLCAGYYTLKYEREDDGTSQVQQVTAGGLKADNGNGFQAMTPD